MAQDHPEILAAAAYSEALNRHTPLLTAFERGLRIVDELFQRLEREMYAGPGYTVEDQRHAGASKLPTKGFIDAKLANIAVQLSRALSQAGAVHARLLADENARADKMSDEDKIKLMLEVMRKKPPAVRQAFANALMSP